ncbi:hypothetical protein FACS1894153_2540 [Bacteroidia bacterium]|nr:hypothetical protein FACS1894153_2540 [Bacteroidia bacterium]
MTLEELQQQYQANLETPQGETSEGIPKLNVQYPPYNPDIKELDKGNASNKAEYSEDTKTTTKSTATSRDYTKPATRPEWEKNTYGDNGTMDDKIKDWEDKVRNGTFFAELGMTIPTPYDGEKVKRRQAKWNAIGNLINLVGQATMSSGATVGGLKLQGGIRPIEDNVTKPIAEADAIQQANTKQQKEYETAKQKAVSDYRKHLEILGKERNKEYSDYIKSVSKSYADIKDEYSSEDTSNLTESQQRDLIENFNYSRTLKGGLKKNGTGTGKNLFTWEANNTDYNDKEHLGRLRNALYSLIHYSDGTYKYNKEQKEYEINRPFLSIIDNALLNAGLSLDDKYQDGNIASALSNLQAQAKHNPELIKAFNDIMRKAVNGTLDEVDEEQGQEQQKPILNTQVPTQPIQPKKQTSGRPKFGNAK